MKDEDEDENDAAQITSMMKQFLFSLPRNIIHCFKGRMIIWHIVAILLTAILVLSGCDWQYFKTFNHPEIRGWMIPAAGIGFIIPIYVPLVLILSGYITKRAKRLITGYAIIQAEVIGLLISSAYKAFTGRAHPLRNGVDDISGEFHFGLLRGGMFWGWPSSHTTIAFAMAITVYTLFPKRRWLGAMAIAYALYIGIGISTTIHWFSDFLAGVIIGTVVGTVVGRSFEQESLATVALQDSSLKKGTQTSAMEPKGERESNYLMRPSGQIMKKDLVKWVVPHLKEHGFVGAFPNFRRIRGDGAHLIGFQFDKWGGGFVVNLAIGPVSGLTYPSGKHIPPENLTCYHNLPLKTRVKPGVGSAVADWFRFDGAAQPPEIYEQVAKQVIPYLQRIEEWFRNPIA